MKINHRNIKDHCSTEQYLLLQCISHFIYKNRAKEINEILQKDFNWNKLVNETKIHSIQPILQTFLFNDIDPIGPQRRNAILKRRQIFLNRNKNLLAETKRVQMRFAEDDIVIVPYKGASLTAQFYQNLSQRIASDLDFAIDLSHYGAVKEIMPQLNYEESKGSWSDADIKKNRNFYLDYPWNLYKEGKLKFNTEFHWQPSHEVLHTPLQFNKLFNKLSQIERNGVALKVFPKIEHALVTLIHHGHVDCWDKLKHFVDLGMILKKLNQKEKIILKSLAEKYGIGKTYQRGLEILNFFLSDKEEAISDKSLKYTEEILKGSLIGNWSDKPIKIKYYLQNQDNFKAKVLGLSRIVKFKIKF